MCAKTAHEPLPAICARTLRHHARILYFLKFKKRNGATVLVNPAVRLGQRRLADVVVEREEGALEGIRYLPGYSNPASVTDGKREEMLEREMERESQTEQ